MQNKIITAIALLLFSVAGIAQETQKKYSLDDVIQLAREQSLDAMVAKHRFRASYWQHRSFKAKYLPDVSLQAEFPQFNRAIK
ncbi:MAG: TolC family protein, partial [Bacteroidota bacterium]